MAVRRALTIEELQQRTRHHDLVITPDAPLALALNRRTTDPRLGMHAATPKNLAAQGIPRPDKRHLFHTLTQATNLSFKEAATRLDLCLSAWEHTGRHDGILDWDRYDVPGTHHVLDILATEDSAHHAREAYTVPHDEDIAIVDYDALTPLDKAILPPQARTRKGAQRSPNITLIEPLTKEPTTLPPFRILPSQAAIMATLADTITRDNADQIGIVLDPTGPLRPLVESLLDAQGIPYQTQDTLNDDPGLRSLLRALRLGLSERNLTGRDVRGLLATIDKKPHPRTDHRLLHAVTDPSVRRLRTLWSDLEGAPIKQALSAFEDLANRSLPETRGLLEDLGLHEEPLTRDLLDALDFYLDTFTIEQDYERDGVLLASAHENAYVDRALVIHLSMDASWTRPTPGYPWIDADHHEQRNLARLERLLQAGTATTYLVQDTRQGQPVTPCFHLHELLDARFETFTDLETQGIASRHASPRKTRDASCPFPPDDPEDAPEPDTPTTLSPSSLNTLATCPRDWYMDQLVHAIPRSHLERGTLLHEFAETYAHHPDAIDLDDDEQLDALIDRCLDEIASYVPKERHAQHRTELRIALTTIANWLDENPPNPLHPPGYQALPDDKPPRPNRIAQHLDLELHGDRTERWFENHALGIHGVVDLLHDRDRIVDWKSTKNPPTLRSTIRSARLDDDTDPDLQPTAYLAHLRSQTPHETLECTLVHVLGNRNETLRNGTPQPATCTIRYHDQPFHEYIATPHAFEALTEKNHNRQRVLNNLGEDAWARLIQDTPLPPFDDKDQASHHELKHRLEEQAREAIGESYKYIEKGARSTLRELVNLRNQALYEDDLDTFEDHVETTRRTLETWQRTRFPVDCDDLSRTRHPDLILRRLGHHAPTAR